MVEDLSAYSIGEVDAAIKAYRRNGLNRFFPTSGQLLAPILEARSERVKIERICSKPMPSDSRPLMWWLKPRKLWERNWREQDAPEGAQVRDKLSGEWRAAWRG